MRNDSVPPVRFLDILLQQARQLPRFLLLLQHLDVLLIAVHLCSVSLWVCLLRPQHVSAVQRSISRDGYLKAALSLHLDLNLFGSLLHQISGLEIVPLNSYSVGHDDARLGGEALSLGPGRFDLTSELNLILFDVLTADEVPGGLGVIALRRVIPCKTIAPRAHHLLLNLDRCLRNTSTFWFAGLILIRRW